MRIELTSRAWEARVISIIRRPQREKFSGLSSMGKQKKPRLRGSCLNPLGGGYFNSTIFFTCVNSSAEIVKVAIW